MNLLKGNVTNCQMQGSPKRLGHQHGRGKTAQLPLLWHKSLLLKLRFEINENVKDLILLKLSVRVRRIKLQSTTGKWPKQNVDELNGICQGDRYIQNVLYLCFYMLRIFGELVSYLCSISWSRKLNWGPKWR